MSEQLKERSEEHHVTHLFSKKYHFFEVTSNSKEKYPVSLKFNCDCRYFSVQGNANDKICSHILACLTKIVKNGGIMTVKEERINACLQLVRRSNRILNKIRISKTESPEHKAIKERICKELLDQKELFITEAIFETGGRCDILILSQLKIIEIVISESDESIFKKTLYYPEGLTIEVVRK